MTNYFEKKQKYFCRYKNDLYICIVALTKRTAPVCRLKQRKNENHS